jgi:hypothetical protein
MLREAVKMPLFPQVRGMGVLRSSRPGVCTASLAYPPHLLVVTGGHDPLWQARLRSLTVARSAGPVVDR